MPVPTLISELSQTPGSCYPTGSESPITADNYLRTYASFIALLRDGKGFTNPVTLASAATCDIGGQNAMFVEITGTTGISSFGTNYYGPRFLRFQGAVTLTHNSTTLNIPGAANFTTAAGDTLTVVPNQALNGWNVVQIQRAASATYAASGANSDITSLTGLTSAVKDVRQIQPISASVAGNALTISASALALEFRSTTLGSGAVTFVQGTPSNLVISSGSTLGTVSGQQSRIVVLAINNAGTIELAAVNITGGNDLTETGLISTTAEGGLGAADSASTIYSTTARSSVAYRVLGYIESTQATAGTWATAPSTIQGRGGQALSAMSSMGYGQTWQNVSRSASTTYYNTTGRPISYHCSLVWSGVGTYCQRGISINGGTTFYVAASGQSVTSSVTVASGMVVIPPGASYVFTDVSVSTAVSFELR